MREHGRKSDETRLGVNRSRLDRCDFMLAQGLAHDLKPARKRGIAEGAGFLARERGVDGRGQRLLGVLQLALRFGESRRNRRDRLTERCMSAFRVKKIEADDTRL